MEFIAAFVWYLVAFALGALVALVLARRFVPARSEQEAFADVPGSRRREGRS